MRWTCISRACRSSRSASRACACTAAAAAKPAAPTPTPRAKPQIPAALQLASADVQSVQPPKANSALAETAEARPQTPADIINARGFWGETTGAPKRDTAAQVVAAVAA